MAGRVEGKVAFITGAAHGQGRATALALAGAVLIFRDVSERHRADAPCRDLGRVHLPPPEQIDTEGLRLRTHLRVGGLEALVGQDEVGRLLERTCEEEAQRTAVRRRIDQHVASGLFPLRHAAFLLPNLAIGAIVGAIGVVVIALAAFRMAGRRPAMAAFALTGQGRHWAGRWA